MKNTSHTLPAIKLVLLTAALGLSGFALADTAAAQTIQVSGTVQETPLEESITPNGISYTASDVLTGSLAGTGVVHIFSSEFGPGVVTDLISKNLIFTSEGILSLEGVGTVSGNTVTAVLVLSVGTGLYQNATGQLNLAGTILPDGSVAFTYTGTITLAQ